ncbi:MAG: hypothetical protein AABN95_02450 [Acidobacteriota bacterium]
MNRIINAFVAGLITTLLVGPVAGQRIWEKKPYTKWTLSEVMRILSDSPWAQTAIQTTRFSYNVPGQSYSATVRLRSALTVRQALVRQKQLAVGYDKLNSVDRARFDAETKEFLMCLDCSKYYILTLASLVPAGSPPVTLSDNVTLQGTQGTDVSVALVGRSLNDLKEYVYLTNDIGERRELVGFIPPAGTGKEAMFVFRRFDDQGKPLISVGTKKFYFAIAGQLFKELGGPLKKFTFAVSPLLQNGEVIF